MAFLLTLGSSLKCQYGLTPSVLVGPPTPALAEGMPVATMDMTRPVENIVTFGTCRSPMNPVFAATGIPGPCMPAPVGPWAPPAPNVIVEGRPAAMVSSRCVCALGGEISVMQSPNRVVEAV
ncbi:DUF4280 domain-containing protein [Inquilinus sp. CA228]|uniref:DUF4280 domain-containing protein n=1 Tax=Inquilinus sp. CA228 TaxID=3455609 RepID=UPI003F8D08C2